MTAPVDLTAACTVPTEPMFGVMEPVPEDPPPTLAPNEAPTPATPAGAELDSDPLFDVTGMRVSRTAHARRVERQRRQMVLGYHPVGIAFGLTLRLHEQAAPADDREAPGLRCGNCAFWQLLEYRKRAYRKCMKEPHAYQRREDNLGRLTAGGRGTDVAGWWPACADFESAPEPDDATD